jgi:hypothetical protein
MEFKKATKINRKLRLALTGPTGAGKTYSALAIASGLSDKVALIDTEHESSTNYADDFDFSVLVLKHFSPQNYIEALKEAADKFEVVVIDSLSHAWNGKGGALEMVDQVAARNKGNTFSSWREVTPWQNRLIDAIVSAPFHVIATMRSKMESQMILNPENNRTEIKKLGMAPIQRDGVEYEFDIVGEIDAQHRLIFTKSRIKSFADRLIENPGADIGKEILAWLSSGKNDEPRITEQQRKKLFAMLTSMEKEGKIIGSFKEDLRNKYHVESSKDLTVSQADEVIGILTSLQQAK